MTTWLDTVAGIVGPRHLITDPDTLAAACLDWRGRYRGRAQAIARPGSTAEVAALVRACVAAGAPIVPQGGNTSHCGAATPDDSGRALIIQLHRMQALRAVDADNNTLTAEAGCTLAQVQDAAAGHQCRRRGGAALWADARADPGPGGGAARWQRAG